MGNYAVTNLNKLSASKAGNIENVVNTVDMQNGLFFTLGSMSATAGQQNVYNMVQPTTASIASGTGSELLLHSSVEKTYLAGQNVTDFVLSANTVGRGFHLSEGDEITIANSVLSNVTGTSGDIGQYLAPQNASYQLVMSATKPSTRFIAQIVGQTTLVQGTVPATVIKVLNV